MSDPENQKKTNRLSRPEREALLDKILGPRSTRSPSKRPGWFRRWLGLACAGAGLGVLASILTGVAVIATPVTIFFGLIEVGTQTFIVWPTVTLFVVLGGGLLGLLAFVKHRA